MILNITRLREDYKYIYKKDWHIAEKINLLIEVTKIEMNSRGHPSAVTQRLEIFKILRSAKISLRTLQRWKMLWRSEGARGFFPKKEGVQKK